LCVFRHVADLFHAEQFCRTAVRFVFRAAAERGDRLADGRTCSADGRGRTTATQSPATTPAQWCVGPPVAEFPGDVRRHGRGRRVQNGRGLRCADRCGRRGDHDRISRLSSTTPPPTYTPPPTTTTTTAAAASSSATAATAATATATAGSSSAPAPTPCPTTPAAATQRTAASAPTSRTAGPGPAAHTFQLSLSTLSGRVAAAFSAAARFADRRSRRHSVRVRTHVGSRAGCHVAQATPCTASPPPPTTTTPPSTAAAAAATRRRRCKSPAPPSTTTVASSASAAADAAANGHVSDD